MPEISFIVPVYRVEPYIHQCISSILQQTFRDFELILVDDGSPDQCPAICDSYAAQDDRVRVIHQENSGVSAARNVGIDAARGTWVYFVDSDDYISPDAAERLHADAMATGADCVMSDCEAHFENGSVLRRRQFSVPFCTDSRETIEKIQKSILCHKFSPHYSAACTNGYAAPWGKFVRLDTLREHRIGFDPYAKGVFDDGVYSLYLLDHVKRFYYNGACTYHYRVIGSSLTHRFKPDALEIAGRNCRLVERFIEKTGKDESFVQAEHCRRVATFASHLSKYFFHPQNPMQPQEVRTAMTEALESETFAPAFAHAHYRYLTANHAYVLFCGRRQLLEGMRFYAWGKAAVKP